MESSYILQWVLLLFGFSFAIGIISPISGVGGGVLFVPLATAFLPFSVDFIRGAGLIMALVSALSASPHLIKEGLTNLKIMYPVAAVSLLTSIAGSITGLWLTNHFPRGEHYFAICLGVLLLFIFFIMMISRRVEYPDVGNADGLSKRLGLGGEWYEASLQRLLAYGTTNLPAGMLLFAAVGFIAGMFGLGAGWANVPVLNMVMGVPIKVAVASSMPIIIVNDAAAAWVYLASGAMLPIIYVPSVAGISIGARIGAKLAVKAKPVFVKYLVLAIMLFAAVINIYKGLRGIGLF
jgi:uncharacterized membrane protein YfcA